ncbi:MAG TPA: amino acid adenylation domain-containing protein [Longimicrobium sp.]
MREILTQIAGLSPQERRALLSELLAAGAPAAPSPPRHAPLSFGQQRLWFLNRLQPGSPLYNIPVALRLGPTDPAVLGRVLDELVRRHESLRTTFAMVDGQPVQVIAPDAGVELALEDLSAVPPEGREAAAAQRAAEDAMRPFDLGRGPLFRARLLRLSAAEHVLLLCMHHIVSDGWSLNVILREMGAIYPALAVGLPSPLPEPELQYADFAEWQREHLSGDVLRAQLDWWTEQLRGTPAVLELPGDRPRPAVQSFRGGVQPLAVAPAVADGLRAVGRREGATPFMVLLAGFQALLHRYSGQDDLVVATPIAGRNRRQTEGMVGFFVNTLALRARFGGDPTFRELVRQVKETTLGAYAHQDLPFERLVEELAPERSLAHNPLVQVVFSFQAAPPGAPLPAVAAPSDTPQFGSGLAKWDLMLFLAETAQGLTGGLEYGTDLFDPPTAERMAAHLQVLLAGAAADPDLPVSALPLLGAAERRTLLGAWAGTDRALPDTTVDRLFAAAAARTPERTAVLADDETLTYAELDRRSNRIARHLRGAGVRPGVPVGLCLERGAGLAAGVLGVLKSGGVYVPLDPAYPPERLAYMLEDAGVAVLVTRAAHAAALPPHGARTLCLDTDAAALAAQDGAALPPAARADASAYVIYTSGSTGRPKGVALDGRGFLNLCLWYVEFCGMTEETRSLLMVPIGFDAALKNVVAPLLVGGAAVLTAAELVDAPAVLSVIAERGVTTINCAPSLFHPLLDHAARGNYAALSSMRELALGGEAPQPDRLRPWLTRHDCRCRLLNIYGPTECTDIAAAHAATPAEVEGAAAVPIGRPIPNVRCYVLDRRMEPQPVGVPGELYVGGVGVGAGYLHRGGLSAAAFVPDPFTPGGRLYRTGDRARWRADGTLEYLGRLDHQVKVRGVRVEPAEVEAALRRHPALAEAAVVARDDAGGARRLVAYFVARGGDGEAPDPAALRAFLRESLPEPVIPTAFVAMDTLPLTPNGKVDRRALPVVDGARAIARAPYVPPRTPDEATLAAIWAEVLRVERVGVNDGFFDLGGHSLLATQVVSRVLDAFGVELPLRYMFERPTVAGLAETLAEEAAAAREGVR